MPSNQAVRAGRAFVELFADDSKMIRALDAVKKRFEGFASFMKRVGATIGGVGAGFLAPLVKVFTDAAKYGSHIDLLSRKIGDSVESVSRLAYGFEHAGVSLEEFDGFVSGLALKISHAADMNDQLIDGLRGLRGRDLLPLSLDERLDAIAERIRGIPNPADRFRVAQDLGLSPKMLEHIERGKEGLDELRVAAQKAGGVMSAEDAQKSTAVVQAWTQGLQALKGIALEVGEALLPPKLLVGDLSENIKGAAASAREWIRENQSVIKVVGLVSAGLVAAGFAIAGLGVAASVAIPIIVALKMAIVATGAVLAAAFSPAGLGIAAIGAATVAIGYFVAQTEQGKYILDSITESLGDVWKEASEVWKGITDALKANNWSLAFQIATKGIELTWSKLVDKLTVVWVGFKDAFVDAFHEGVKDVRLAMIEAISFMTKLVAAAKSADLSSGAFSIGVHAGSSTEGDEEKEAEKKKIEAQYEADKKNRQAFRDKQMQDAKDAAKGIQEELNALKAQASAEAANAARIAAKPKEPPSPKEKRQERRLPTAQQVADHVKGIFAGPAGQQLAIGDTIAKRQLDAAVNTANNTTVLPQMAKALNTVVGALKFK